MFASRRPAGRFSLLLLDENEFYVKDFVATCTWPPDVTGNKHGTASLSGQLRLCTKSLFFEPDDARIPIVRLPFQYLEQLEGIGKQELAAVALRWYKMKANAADEPYIFEKGRSSSWNFRLTYAALSDCMPLAQRMLVASRLSKTDQEALLDEVLAEVEGSFRFDPGHLRSPSTETIVLEIPAMRLAPLIHEPCRLVITNTRLYLQLLHNISGDAAVLSHPLAGIAAVARRRSSLKDIGLEVFFLDPPKESIQGPLWGAASTFLSFKAQQERDHVVETINSQTSLGEELPGGRSTAAACGSVLEASGSWLQRVTAAWQHGLITNFDYLLYCNLAAGRSFNDLTQYPVFPWVVQDYSSTILDLQHPSTFRDLSRPIGALNPIRLAQFKERFREMALDSEYPGSDPPFLYGTHYSCPGYTMFWLVRAAPAHMLRLQNGKFDAADRLFCSISEAWESVLANQADVKELIPEFFMPEQRNFLLNSKRLALGVRQNGRLVGDVELPCWAENSVDKFLALHRAALESPFVSANLHHWIDLIFGYKQRGQAAVEADNVFRHLTYEGAIDPETITDRVQRAATEVAINEFGQCPRQIFKHPHPSRLVCPDVPEILEGQGSSGTAATSPTFSSPRHSSGYGTSTTSSSANAGQSLSLSLVSAIIATLKDEKQPHSREVPALLRELDVLAKRKDRDDDREKPQQQQQPEQEHRQEQEKKEERKEKGSNTSTQSAAGTPAPASPFASAKAGLVGTWSAFKDALGEREGSITLKNKKEAGGNTSNKIDKDQDNSTSTTTATSSNLASQNSSGSVGNRLSGLLAGKGSSLSSRWASATSGLTGSSGAAASGDSRSIRRSLDVDRKDDSQKVTENSATRSPSLPLEPVFWKKASTPSPASAKTQIQEIEEEENQVQDYGISTSNTPLNLNSVDVGGGDGITQFGEWGSGLRDRLTLGRSFIAGSEGVNAIDVGVSFEGKTCVYIACHDGFLRIFDAKTGGQLRACAPGAGQPLTSIALLNKKITSPSSSSSFSKPQHQMSTMVLCGSYDGNVYVYNPLAGIVQGSFIAHADAVSCIALSSSNKYLVTSSWDCSVKLWSLKQGLQPWDSTLPQPVSEFTDLPGGIWALALAPTSTADLSFSSSSPAAASPSSAVGVLVGTEEGHVVYLDMRSPGVSTIAWQKEVSQDYIGGVAFRPNVDSGDGDGNFSGSRSTGYYALAASADGTLALLDSRRGGEIVSTVNCGTSLRCCTTDGAVAIAGGESGAVHFWDVAQQLGRPPPAGALFDTAPGFDGLYPPLSTTPASPVSSLSVKSITRGGSGGGDSESVAVCMATGHEGGVVRIYWG